MTFASLARVLAVLLVAVALWLARPPAAPKPVAVLVFPGAARELVAPGENTSVLAAGTIALPPATTGASFWRRLFALADDGATEPSGLLPLWSDARGPMRALRIPARLFLDEAASTANAFVGSSAGVVVEASDITSGRLPHPYDRAADAIAAASATLRAGEWSEWITIEPLPVADTGAARGPTAQFQFARVSDTTYFFAPAYAMTTSAARASPFLRGAERDLRPLLAGHAIELSRRLLDGSRKMFSKDGDLRPVVVFDSVVEDTTAVFAPDSTPASVMEQVRAAISAQLAALEEAVGAGGIVLVVGGPGTARSAGETGWYQILEAAGGSGDDAKPQPLDFEAARTMLRYVAGFPLTAQQKQAVPDELVRAAPVRPVAVRTESAARPQTKRSEWSASNLESVPGALGDGK